jgi:RNA-binding protein 39
VLEECQKYGPVVHIVVDKFSKGNVFVKFVGVEGAVATKQVMHGRFFGGQMITAEYMTENS